VIEDIAARVRTGTLAVPLSVALGEMNDWDGDDTPPRLPSGVMLAKMGLSNLAGNREWQVKWRQIRQRFDSFRNQCLQWVAVAYADENEARSPGVDEVLTAALESDCAGVLVDTFSKTGRGLTDFICPQKLAELADRCHASGLFLALAGGLKSDRLFQLRDVAADVIAIRSAACQNSERCGTVSAASVRGFRSAMVHSLHRNVAPQLKK